MDLATQTRCNELMSHLLTLPQRPAGNKAASLVVRIVRECGGPDAFKASGVDGWREAFRRLYPADKFRRGLGQITVFYLREAQRWLKAEDERRIAEKAVAEDRRKRDAAPEARFSRRQIRALADLMEVCDFASVDLREVGYLFKAFEVEMEPGLAGQEPAAGETEKEGKQ